MSLTKHLSNFNGFLLDFTGFHWVSQYFTKLSFTGFYLVLPSFNGFSWVRLGFTRFVVSLTEL